MKYAVILFAVMALFTCMVSAGHVQNPNNPDRMLQEARAKGNAKTKCLSGKKKNGKCIRSVLRVRSADTDDFFEIRDVEDAHWGDQEEREAEIM